YSCHFTPVQSNQSSPLKTSLSLSRKPFRCGSADPSSVEANSLSNCLCRSVSFFGTSISTCTSSSPTRCVRTSGQPLPLILKTSPCCVPEGISSFSTPLSVGTSTLDPSAACAKVIGNWQTRSLLCRLK